MLSCKDTKIHIKRCSRFLNLSDPSRHLVTPDPDIENWLPIDDAAFNDGVSKFVQSAND